MQQENFLNLWMQIFLLKKYLNLHFKKKLLKNLDITPNDFFFLVLLGHYKNLTFYEINKYIPYDGKSLHKKITTFVDKGYLIRTYEENGTSFITLSEKARVLFKKTKELNSSFKKNPFGINNLTNLAFILNIFNDELREILAYPPTTELDSKKLKYPDDFGLWVQISLSYKYLHEYLREDILREYQISPIEFFLVITVSYFSDLSFYEINKYLPLDNKNLHTQFSQLIKKRWIKREFDSNGKSKINIEEKVEETLSEINKECVLGFEKYSYFNSNFNLFNELSFFNKKMIVNLNLKFKNNFNKIKKS